MRHDSRTTSRLIGLFGLSAILAAAEPSAAETPYQGIAGRNAFSLRPPPSLPPVPAVKTPARKLTLAGILTIFPSKQAILNVAPSSGAAAKPGQAAERPGEHSCMLAEGQRRGGITVLQIDEKLHRVKVEDDGTVETLSFDDEMRGSVVAR